jgi:hypothetical protein
MAARTAALQSVDRLDEASPVARVDVEVGPQQPHHGLVLAKVAFGLRSERLVAEVARHPELDAGTPQLVPRAEAAAREQDGAGECGE